MDINEYCSPERSFIDGSVKIFIFQENNCSLRKEDIRVLQHDTTRFLQNGNEWIKLKQMDQKNVKGHNLLTPLSTVALTSRESVPVSPFTNAVLN